MKAPFLIGALIVLCVMIATACAGSPTPPPPVAPTTSNATAAPAPTFAPTATKAPLKGELNLLCTAVQDFCLALKKEFETKTPGVTVNVTQLNSATALTRVSNDKSNPAFDLWWGAPIDALVVAKQTGLLDQYKSAHNANIVDQKAMLDADANWIGIYVNPLGFATNSKYVDSHPGFQAPTSLDDLTAPALKSQIAMAHPSATDAAYTFLCGAMQIKSDSKGWDYLKSFTQNISQYTNTDAASLQSVGKGDAAVGVFFAQDIAAGIDQGLSLKLTFPKEGTGFQMTGMAIIRGAKNSNLAKVFYDWTLDPGTLDFGAKYNAYPLPTVKDAKPARPELTQVKLLYDFSYCLKNKSAFLDKFSSDILSASQIK